MAAMPPRPRQLPNRPFHHSFADGRRGESSQKTRCGLIGLASLIARASSAGIAKVRADHQQGVAAFHQLPAGLRAEQPDRARDEGQRIGHRHLAEQASGRTGKGVQIAPTLPVTGNTMPVMYAAVTGDARKT